VRTVLVSVAEPSGDVLAAELIAALRARHGGALRVRGVVGPALRAQGVEAVAAMEDIAVMGLAEVLRRLGPIRRARAAMAAAIEAGGDVFIGVDAPDFQSPLAALARRRGMRAVGYVSPQVWAWRKGRVPKIAARWDQLLCLLAFEPALYAGTGLDARFTGHPVVDRLPSRGSVDPLAFALLPGSRRQELRRMGPVFFEVASQIRARRQGAHFHLVVPEALSSDLPPLPTWITRAQSVSELSTCRAALTKSGTVTLELAVMGVPQVVAHRVHPLTHWIGRRFVRGVRHIAMPNVLADRGVVPEHIQHLDPQALTTEVLALPEDQPVDLAALGGPGASDRAAAAILEAW